MEIIFTGDIGFDRYMDKQWSNSDLLSKEICDFLNGADHVVANVEGALYEPKNISTDGLFFHAMNPQAVTALKRMKADVWCISNNHIMDAGEVGLISTKKIALQERCLTFGAGMNESEASLPIYFGDKESGVGLISVGYNNECIPATSNSAGCFSWDEMELIAERITEIKEKYRWCVVVSHGGEEFAPMPLPYTRQRYLKFLELGADVVVGHHPHVAENYELLENGKMIFYSLGNFIFDTDYQRAHLYTDIGILLKLRFTDKRIDFDAMGVKIDRKHKLIKECPLPDIFTEVPSEEYDLLAPLAARAFVVEDMKTLRFMSPTKYDNDAAFDEYFSSCNCQEAYVKGSHMDYDIILPISEEYKNNNWKNSKLENVKNYILNLL